MSFSADIRLCLEKSLLEMFYLKLALDLLPGFLAFFYALNIALTSVCSIFVTFDFEGALGVLAAVFWTSYCALDSGLTINFANFYLLAW